MANVIDSLNFGNTKYSFTLPYGSCSTAAATAAKTVTVDNFNLDTGARIAVKFTVTNTASSPTLNVNSTGAKAIYYRGAAISAGKLAAKHIYEFVYDGTNWELMGDLDTNSTYTVNNATITLTAGTGLTGGGNFTTNQSSAETITLSLGTSGATAGTYGPSADVSGTNGTTIKVPEITVDTYGRVTGITNRTYTSKDTNTTYSNFVKSGSGAKAGLVPAPSTTAGTTKYLREDGTWTVPTNTTYYAHSDGGLLLASNGFKVNTGFTTSGKNYKVQIDSDSGGLFVNVPWTDTNTTYSFTNKAATLAWGTTSTIATVGGTDITVTMPSNPDTNTDKKAASGNTSSKIFLIGATSQSSSGQTTYSHDTAYVDTDGCLYSGGTKVLTAHQSLSNYSTLANTIKSLSISGQTITYTKGDGTTGTLTTQDTNTTYSAATSTANGLMTSAYYDRLMGIAEGANKYVLPNATSSVLGGVKVGSNITVSSGTISLTKANVTSALGYTPPTTNTTYSTMGAATSSAAGTAGLVPAPAAGKQASFLRGDGTWAVPTNTTYSAATTSTAGLMSAADKSKLDGITASADTVSFSRNLTSGTKVGTITINGTATDLYCETNTNTTYSAGSGLSLSSTTFAVNTGYTTSGKNYAIKVDSTTGGLYVNVPWTDTDTNTTYSQATSSALGLVKIGYSTSGKNYAVQLNSSGQMYVNVPWTDNNTTYSVVSRTADGIMASTYYAHLIDHTHSYNNLTNLPSLLAIGTTSTTAAAGNHTHTTLSNALTLNHASTTNMFRVQKSGSNVFLVTNAGKVYSDGGYYSPAADYAEFMEWEDANSLDADRRGLFVVMEYDSNLIRVANDTDDIDDIVGIVSARPSMVGNDAELHWNKKYVTDIFGNIEMETITQPEYIDDEGNIIPAQVVEIPKLNPDYDPNVEYIPRSQRKEWAVIGLLGQIVMVDDGTCIVGKRCRNGANGVATLSNSKEGWRVIERLDDTHIKVLFK